MKTKSLTVEETRPDGTKVKTTIRRLSEWNEWRVRLYLNGEFQSDYFTPWKDDAIGTAKLMRERA